LGTRQSHSVTQYYYPSLTRSHATVYCRPHAPMYRVRDAPVVDVPLLSPFSSLPLCTSRQAPVLDNLASGDVPAVTEIQSRLCRLYPEVSHPSPYSSTPFPSLSFSSVRSLSYTHALGLSKKPIAARDGGVKSASSPLKCRLCVEGVVRHCAPSVGGHSGGEWSRGVATGWQQRRPV
jgi:hypothetical protein